jgi:sedoheptulokinase
LEPSRRKKARELGLTPGLPVAVALGDNQASLLATLGDPDHGIAITLGTGAQASAVLPPGETIADPPTHGQSYEFRPYPGGRLLATAAPLCGGSAWAWLARTVNSWQRELGLPEVAEAKLYAKLNALGLAAAEGPQVAPHFAGERHAPTLRGSITGIGGDELPLGHLARGLARGLVANLRDMLPPCALVGRTRLVGSGNALRRNRLLQVMAEETFALPLVMSEGREEAALGAALNARSLAK